MVTHRVKKIADRESLFTGLGNLEIPEMVASVFHGRASHQVRNRSDARYRLSGRFQSPKGNELIENYRTTAQTMT